MGLTISTTIITPLSKSDTLVLKLKEVLNERARGQEPSNELLETCRQNMYNDRQRHCPRREKWRERL